MEALPGFSAVNASKGKGSLAFEKSFPYVVAAFAADGTASGLATVATTAGLHSKQTVTLSGVGLPALLLQVKRVYSATTLTLGPISSNMDQTADLSAYTVLANSGVVANQQERPGINGDSITRAVYEEEPAVAIRVLLVDRLGNPVGSSGGVAEDVNVAKWGGVATSLGQKDMANSVPVTLASNQPAIPVNIFLAALTPQFNALASAGITGATPATANTVLTATADRTMFTLKNTLNRTVRLTLNGALWLELDGNVNASFDFGTNGRKLAAGDVVGVYCPGVKPANGSLALTLM